MICPICGKPVVARYRPFCSGRCADIDLGKWMSGHYALPSTDPEDAEEAAAAAEAAAARSEDDRH